MLFPIHFLFSVFLTMSLCTKERKKAMFSVGGWTGQEVIEGGGLTFCSHQSKSLDWRSTQSEISRNIFVLRCCL